MDLLETTRIALALTMLAGAAILDLQSRRVPNGYWMPFLAAALALLAVDAGDGIDLLPLAAAAATSAFAYGAWWMRLFGGADAKAIMVASLLAPALQGPEGFALPLVANAVMNGTLLALAFPLVLLAVNLASGRRSLPASLLGLPMPLELARKRHVWPMQDVRDGAVRWSFGARVGMDAQAAYARLEAAGAQKVWVTAKIPFVALIALGALVQVVAGNLLLSLLALLALM